MVVFVVIVGVYPVDLRGVSVTVSSMTPLVFIVPMVAAAGVFAGATQRGMRGSVQAGLRHPIRGALSVAAAQALVGMLGVAATAVIVMLTEQIWVLPHLPLLGVAAVCLLAASFTGQVLGRFIPAVIAAPLVLALGYGVMAVPPAMHPLWLRHLFLVGDCCSPDQTISPRVLTAQVLFWGTLILAGVVMTLRKVPRLVGAVAGIALVALGAQVAAAQVDELAWSPASPRDGDLSCAQARTAEVCVWPEHKEALPGLATVLDLAADVADERDLDIPGAYSEDLTAAGAPLFTTSAEPVELAVAVSHALPPNFDHCADADGQIPSRLANAYYLLLSWWMGQLGVPAHYDTGALWAEDYLVEGDDTNERIRHLTAALETCDPSLAPPE
ncbi:hypothetical protein [Georgenia sp. Marseille-Q6866]